MQLISEQGDWKLWYDTIVKNKKIYITHFHNNYYTQDYDDPINRDVIVLNNICAYCRGIPPERFLGIKTIGNLNLGNT